jgi:hypothetical protein
MRRVLLVVFGLVSGASLMTAGSVQKAPGDRVPPGVAALLERARIGLQAGGQFTRIRSLDVTGTETRALGARSKVDPYEFKLLPPDNFQMRVGPLLHVVASGAYSRRLVDPARYGGSMVNALMGDAASQKAAARGMQMHLLRLSLGFLVQAPSGAVVTAEDQGVRDFVRVKGRTIAFRIPAERIQVDLVLDPATSLPLATVSHGRTSGQGGVVDSDWVSLLTDYREVAGVRFPHRIEEWVGTTASTAVLTRVSVNGLKPEDFVAKPPAPR